jgi:hypothetical protein
LATPPGKSRYGENRGRGKKSGCLRRSAGPKPSRVWGRWRSPPQKNHRLGQLAAHMPWVSSCPMITWGGLVDGRGHRNGQLRVTGSRSTVHTKNPPPRTEDRGAPGGVFFPALSTVSLCAYVHAHSHYGPRPALQAAQKRATGGGPHVPIGPGPATLCTTEADDGNYTPCQSVGAIAKKAGALARDQTQVAKGLPVPCATRPVLLCLTPPPPPPAAKSSR